LDRTRQSLDSTVHVEKIEKCRAIASFSRKVRHSCEKNEIQRTKTEQEADKLLLL